MYEVYDIGIDGKAQPKHDIASSETDEGLAAASVWETIRIVNDSGDVCGRMTILQEPTPIMLAGIHMTMRQHFDMDELLEALVSSESTKGRTKAFMHRAFETNMVRQRSFLFVFKYHTVVGEDIIPSPWQQYDHRPPDRRSPDHIDIAECSSVLALSLGGKRVKEVEARRRRGRVQKGAVYDASGPWHLLNIQYFPDNEHSMRSEDIKKPFYDGPYAFLDSLAIEYRDAVKRYMQLNDLITKLITPPSDFMFDVKTRDKLLFEDKYFTYSRRYFWAYTTLGVLNDGIMSMRSAYSTNFTNDFWTGGHQSLWPHPQPESVAGRAYMVRMQSLRHEIERAVRDLLAVYNKNDQTRKEIRSLREQLFSGSSVKESRRAIEQGDNIKVLTGVSMVFLPLTFVTSVFGITEFTIAADDWRFPVTMVSVCVPFFLLILVLQTRSGMDATKKLGTAIDHLFQRVFKTGDRRPHVGHPSSGAGPDGAEGKKKKRPHRTKRNGLKRTQSGFTDVAPSIAARERAGRWLGLTWQRRYALPWKRGKPAQDPRRPKEGEV
ncbi:hypothetical protein GQ53DRAFT_657891 [Thozetella sp. PMI_491]|nr:hypothetical protein GQ53DRAFT_657891 [Thozetella sp. PMI_491]